MKHSLVKLQSHKNAKDVLKRSVCGVRTQKTVGNDVYEKKTHTFVCTCCVIAVRVGSFVVN